MIHTIILIWHKVFLPQVKSWPRVILTCAIPNVSGWLREERGRGERARQLLPKQWLYICSFHLQSWAAATAQSSHDQPTIWPTSQPASLPPPCPCTIHDPPLCQQQLKKSEGRSRGERGKKSNFCWVVLSSSCPGISSRVFPGKGDRSGGRYSSRWICYFAVDLTEVLANLAHKKLHYMGCRLKD